MKHIGIVGSRRRDTNQDFALVKTAFLGLYQQEDVIVSGGCKQGADSFAVALRDAYGVELKEFLPDKSKLDPVLLRTNPRAAYAIINYARNKPIAETSDYLIACVAPDRRGGTEDTIKHFKRKCKRLGWSINERLMLV